MLTGNIDELYEDPSGNTYHVNENQICFYKLSDPQKLRQDGFLESGPNEFDFIDITFSSGITLTLRKVIYGKRISKKS